MALYSTDLDLLEPTSIERVAEWLRRLTRKPMVRTAVGSKPALDNLVAVRNSSPGRPEPCEGNLVAAAGSCGGLMVKHPWPLLEISLSDFRRLATLNINTYLPKLTSYEEQLLLECPVYQPLRVKLFLAFEKEIRNKKTKVCIFSF